MSRVFDEIDYTAVKGFAALLDPCARIFRESEESLIVAVVKDAIFYARSNDTKKMQNELRRLSLMVRRCAPKQKTKKRQ